jgi:hypothetical protein
MKSAYFYKNVNSYSGMDVVVQGVEKLLKASLIAARLGAFIHSDGIQAARHNNNIKSQK